jgi:outer membrane protein
MKTSMKKNLLAILLLGWNIISAQTQGSTFSLQQALDFAVKNSPGFANAQLDQQTASHKRWEVAGIGLPQVSASIDLKDYIEIPTQLIPGDFVGAPPGTFIPVRFGTKYNSTAGITASQLIFSSDYIVGLQASKEYINLSRINVTRTKTDLIADVSKAYYNAIINRERIKLLEANVEKLKKIFNDTKAMNAQGFVELIDVERLEVQLNNLVTEKDKVIKLIALSENVLKFQMGYKISDPIVLSDSLNVIEKEDDLIATYKPDASKRPEYQLMQSQQKLYELDIKRLRLGYLPTLAAYGAYQYNAQRQQFNFFETDKKWFNIALIGATINLNIFDGFQNHQRIQQARILANKNQNSIRTFELAAEMEATAAGTIYQNAYSTMLIQKKNMELAMHVYDVAQKKYNGGVGSNIEIVNAETSLKEAQTNYFNAVYDMIVAKIDFQKATGTLTK